MRAWAVLVTLSALLLGATPATASGADAIVYARVRECSGKPCGHWELTMGDGRVVSLPDARVDRGVPFLQVSGDGLHVLYQRASDSKVVVRDLVGDRVHPLPLDDVYENSVGLSANGRLAVISGGAPSVVSVTDLSTGKTYDLFDAGKSRKTASPDYDEFETFSPDDRYLLVGSSILPQPHGTEYTVLDGHGRKILRRVVAGSARMLTALAGDHTTIALPYDRKSGHEGVRLYNLRTGRSSVVPVDLPKALQIHGLAWDRDE